MLTRDFADELVPLCQVSVTLALGGESRRPESTETSFVPKLAIVT